MNKNLPEPEKSKFSTLLVTKNMCSVLLLYPQQVKIRFGRYELIQCVTHIVQEKK